MPWITSIPGVPVSTSSPSVPQSVRSWPSQSGSTSMTIASVSVAPWGSVTVTVAVYVPGAGYVCDPVAVRSGWLTTPAVTAPSPQSKEAVCTSWKLGSVNQAVAVDVLGRVRLISDDPLCSMVHEDQHVGVPRIPQLHGPWIDAEHPSGPILQHHPEAGVPDGRVIGRVRIVAEGGHEIRVVAVECAYEYAGNTGERHIAGERRANRHPVGAVELFYHHQLVGGCNRGMELLEQASVSLLARPVAAKSPK